jgi:tetratricopeptide (TPR) repeat protein
MSYIIEALKKAQKEKDSNLIRYFGAIKGSSQERSLWGRKFIYSSLLTFVLISLVFVSYSWLDLSIEKKPPESEQKVVVKEHKVGGDIGKSDLYDKAGRLYKDGNFQEAKELYEAALSLDPGYVEALNNLGVIYLRQKDHPRAKQALEKAVRLNPLYVEPYYNLACLHTIIGETKQGFTYLKKALAIDSSVKTWARDDSDLENLRTLPEFVEIITE